ncbi:IS3 family transposase [Anaerotruncus colihominis]|uniref:IS3 family transposase n=1 Tax=Anaerotruncus colihominis TaxID=169435 RepID=UPI0018994618
MSRKGDPYDNAVTENFFSCLKCELIHLKQYPARQAAQTEVFVYMEAFYNTIRPHSTLGWLSPVQYEAALQHLMQPERVSLKITVFHSRFFLISVSAAPGRTQYFRCRI